MIDDKKSQFNSFDIEELLKDPWPVTDEKAKLLQRFTASESDGKRFVLGKNSESESIIRQVRVDGIVDDFARSDQTWNGIPLLHGKEIPQEGIVVNCSTSINPVSASNRLSKLSTACTFPYADLCRMFPDKFPIPEFVAKTNEDIKGNLNSWQNLLDKLADDESKKTLSDLIRFRVTADPSAMSDYVNRPQEQYFEKFLGLGTAETFVDAGGFDGDTTEGFIGYVHDFNKIFLFEPSLTNLEKAKLRLQGTDGIEFISKGVSDEPGELFFNPNAGSASSVQEEGGCKISVTTIDEEVGEPLSFIKMDLEGWELQALVGAQHHIKQNHPKLAICVYHKPEDFRLVPQVVLGFNSRYKIYLRHYTEGWSETVMYFAPN
jgi:FkbM family methyltransferase